MKILFFVDPKWAFGLIHQELVKHLCARGWQSDVLSWLVSYSREEVTLIASQYDRVVTIASGLDVLVNQYQVPPEKIIAFCYSDYDITKAKNENVDALFDRVAGYAVPSHNLLSISLSMGVRRIPQVLPIGLTLSRYAGSVPKELKTVGYGTAMARQNHFGVEFKRGDLAQECATLAGLEFRPAHSYNYLAVPRYWQTVDCILASALYETAPIPQLEAAASGRLVLTSSVGNTAELAAIGIAELLPSNINDFRTAAVERLLWYKDNPNAFTDRCERGREAMKRFDWPEVLPQWQEFFKSTSP